MKNLLNKMILIQIRSSSLFLYVHVMLCAAEYGQSFNYESMFGARRLMQAFSGIINKNAFPEPLPPKPKSVTLPVMPPYHNLYQGIRNQVEKRVYREKFQFDAISKAQQVSYDGAFDCPLSFLAVETEKNIPIVFRGGVGYNYFNIIIKSRPNESLKGQIRAYCLKTEYNYYRDRQTEDAEKSFIFSDRINNKE